jgi:hypothetical protein
MVNLLLQILYTIHLSDMKSRFLIIPRFVIGSLVFHLHTATFIMLFHTKFHVLSSIGSLIIAMKLKDKKNFSTDSSYLIFSKVLP